jgi:FtsP/CotA-like multicopper oxidase with cupredoxin domain
MLAYKGSVPGPTLRVKQGSELVVGAVNEGDLEPTVHWHGLRLENRLGSRDELGISAATGGNPRRRFSLV